MADPVRVCLDSNVIIRALLQKDDIARTVFTAAAERGHRVVVSALSIVEMPKVIEPQLRRVDEPRLDASRVAAFHHAVDSLDVMWVTVDHDVARLARDLCMERSIRTFYDAVVAASAVVAGASVLVTLDSDDFPIGTTLRDTTTLITPESFVGPIQDSLLPPSDNVS